jgi:hypothetical protein
VRLSRALKMTAAMVATAALGVSAASALVTRTPATVTPRTPVALPGSDRAGQAAPDPGGGIPWAVRRYVSTSGASCAEAGRISDGRFGQIHPDGAFNALALEQGGACGDLVAEPVLLAINHYPAAGQRPARTVLFGLARSDVSALEVTGPDGVRRPLVAGVGGEFVLPLAGTIAPTAVPVRVTLLTGQQLTFDWR